MAGAAAAVDMVAGVTSPRNTSVPPEPWRLQALAEGKPAACSGDMSRRWVNEERNAAPPAPAASEIVGAAMIRDASKQSGRSQPFQGLWVTTPHAGRYCAAA